MRGPVTVPRCDGVRILTGTWRKLATPVTIPANGVPSIEGNYFRVRIAGVVVSEQEMVVVTEDYVPVNHPVTIKEAYFFKEKPMPGVSATMTNVTVNQTTGAINFVFPDGGLQYPDLETAKSSNNFDTDPELPKRLLIAKALANSPDGANLTTMVGGSCLIDFNADTPIVITPPN